MTVTWLLVGAALTVTTGWGIRVSWILAYPFTMTTPLLRGSPPLIKRNVWPLPALDQHPVNEVPVTTLSPVNVHLRAHAVPNPGSQWASLTSTFRNAPGLVRVRVSQIYGDLSHWEATEAQPWSLVRHPDPPKQAPDGTWSSGRHPYIETACGWPFLALYERTADEAGWHPSDSPAIPVPGWDDHTYWFQRRTTDQHPVRLPIVPIWPAFLYNTVFYAAVTWLVVRLALAAKRGIVGLRRARRGLCPSCAYPRVKNAPCPECGRR